MDTINPDSVIEQARLAAQAAGVRAVVVVSGEAAWGRALAAAWARAQDTDGLWLSAEPPTDIPAGVPAQARHYLGCELAWLVVDVHAGLDVEALAATAGALRGGGVLLWLLPAGDQLAAFLDPDNRRITQYPAELAGVGRRFWQRLEVVLGRHSGISWVTADGAKVGTQPMPATPDAVVEPPARTVDQATAITALLHVVHGHRRRPLVLSADRGRGKSAALGIAAAALLCEGRRLVLLTAPRVASVQTVFEQAMAQLPGAERDGNAVVWQGSELRYLPPDALEAERPAADLVLVDEAAAIPVPLLERLLRHYSRIAFATTVHGYEGTGRGFAIRFRAILDDLTPQWRELKLHTPIRWAEGDPLEALINDLLLLDAEPAALSAAATPVRALHLAREELAGDEGRLRELFGLLVGAHYQTSPQDLRHLLDAPDVEVFCLDEGGHVAAVALVVREGELPPELGQAVLRGERRLRGHLIAQSLLHHAGMPAAAPLRAWRIVRVAVHPQRRRQGLGAALLAAVAGYAQEAGVDYLGASFGGEAELYAFWRAAAYTPARVGLRRDAASGTHSLVVLKGLSEAGRRLAEGAMSALDARLPRLLAEPLQDLDPGLAVALLGGGTAPSAIAWDAHWQWELESFAAGWRGYELCVTALTHAVTLSLGAAGWSEVLTPEQWRLLVRKVVQQVPWPVLVREGGFNGRSDAEAALREVFATLAPRLAGLID